MTSKLSIKKLLKTSYVFCILALSFYFFIIGSQNYNAIKVSKIKSIKIENSLDNKRNDIEEKNINEKIYNLSRLTEGLKNFSWKLKEDNNTDIDFNNTEVALLLNQMKEDDYDLDKVSFNKEIPGFFVKELPDDISFIKNTKQKKKLFISIVLPLIVEENRNIDLKRTRLLKLYNKLNDSKTLTLKEHNWLINLAAQYPIETKHVHKIAIAENLLKYVDIIPNSIALAQAAKESGWGTSRFAIEGNALFGQWTFDYSKGLLPQDRESGHEHLVKSFDNLKGSVKSYMNNINTHKAYDSFREKRLEYRNNNKRLDPIILVHELSSYAELPNYTESLQLIIEKNKLFNFDDVELINRDSLA